MVIGEMTITRERMTDWAETYDEAVDTLLLIANDKDYTRKEMLWSINNYEEQVKLEESK